MAETDARRWLMRVRDRLLMVLMKLEEEEENSLRGNLLFLGEQLESGVARVRRRVASIDNRTRVWLGCAGAGVATIFVSMTVAQVGAVGSGYFLRFGILLLGVGLHQLLRR